MLGDAGVRGVNTSNGVNSGAEGMELAHLASAEHGNSAALAALELVKRHAIVYADPVDLTKMLGIVPSTETLDGVRNAMWMFLA